MRKLPVVETQVTREESCMTKLMKKRNNFFIFHSLPANVMTYLLRRY